uniref:Carboxylic ester hydrolase n=1 Tax=Syphacia muris TaxID=451379 RepID=A0A0N5AA55_9BILA
MGVSSSYFGKTDLRSNAIETGYGKVVGKRYCVAEGKYADAFLGIPFAKPPIGDLRFKYPEPPDSWDGVRLCLKHGDRCAQKDLFLQYLQPRINASEDCLYLNVFAPSWDLPADQPSGRAVMVFIHGGGFVTHSSANYGDENICRHLCTKEVIVVTIQYRLGIFGFLATGDSNSIPNLGLWDQTLALKWVKENIKQFGGNPENITVFGQSAGGASADMLCLSPKSNKYFNKVIPIAGAVACPWAIKTVSEIRNTAIKQAKSCGWQPPSNVSDKEINKSLVDFLRQLPSKKLGVGLQMSTENDTFSASAYTPVLDGNFFPEPISELRKKLPKMLCMAGTCEYEALIFMALARGKLNIKNREKIIKTAVSDAKYNDAENLRKEIEELYFKNEMSKEEMLKSYATLLSKMFINRGVSIFAREMATAGHTVYLYSFQHFNNKCFGFLKFFFPFEGATHAGELPFLFGKSPETQFTMTEDDIAARENITTLFTNFAKYGNPNGKSDEKVWKPVSADGPLVYLGISAKDNMMKADYEDGQEEFWKKVEDSLKVTNAA